MTTSLMVKMPNLATDCPDCGGTFLIPVPNLPSSPVHNFYTCECPESRASENYQLGFVHGGNEHSVTLVRENGRVAWVDRGIAPDVRLLWKNGIWTQSSCEDDYDGDSYIILVNPDDAIRAVILLSGRYTMDETENTVLYS